MEISVENNVVYDEKHGLTLDIYKPNKANGYGLIDIHGGGWFQGDKSKDEDLSRKLAEEGYMVLTPNYRSASENIFPAARDDIFLVYDWFKEKYTDIEGIGVIGSSSGGNLAIELSMSKGIPAVSWSGIIDLDHWIYDHSDLKAVKDQKQDSKKLSSHKIDQGGPNDSYYKWFVLNYVGNDEELLRDASLLHRIDGSAGPMFLVNSMNELSPVNAVIKLEEKLADKNVPVMTKLIPGGRHGKGYMEEAWSYTLDFLKSYICNSKNR